MKTCRMQMGDIATIIDGDRGSNYPKQNEFFDKGFCLFLNAGNVTSEGFVFEKNSYISAEKDKALRKGKLKRGDIVYTTRGTIGNVAYYKSTVPFENIRINSGMVILRVNEELIDAEYLYQYLKSTSTREYFLSFKTGSAQPQLPIKNFSRIQINVPDISSQKHIASILSAYDDLIENNRRQIKLLEEAAQRLYREWFVELRFPGHEDVKIVDGVPEGWKAETIGNVCCTIGGGTPSTKEKTYYEGGNIPWVTPTDITRNGCLILLETEKKITEEGLAHSSAKMVPAWTILMTSRASVGYFGICEFPVCTNQGFISCIPYQENMRFYLLHNLMNRVDEIRAKAGGSTYLEISKSTFRDMKIIVPADEILNSFEESIQKLMMKMKNCKEQNRILTSARDRLLPKLMSGEVEV